MSDLAVTLTVEELRALIRDELRRALAQGEAKSEGDAIMTREEVAELLRVHPRVVTHYVQRRGLPGAKIIRQWRFRRSEVLAWQEQKRWV